MTAPTGIPQRESWATRAGFILAAVGSAVGLGNMWRFSYIASEGGGAAFVLLYVVIVLAVGIPLMTAEFVVGRMSQESPARALKRLGGKAWAPLGWLFVFCGLGILSYYSVIAGWTMRYAVDAVRNAIPEDTAAYFAQVSSGGDAVIAHLVFMAITIYIVAWGVKKGIERASLIMMPLLFLILIGLALWAATLPGGGAGYAYYLKPDLRRLLEPEILADAAGQAFFSLSLGMGAMMTYASYLKSEENLGREAATVAFADTGVAFVAGLVVFPVIFSFGLTDQVSESTVGALFISLPKGFELLGRLGDYIDTAFFVMLFFAALTSAISLLEVVVAALVDVWNLPRRATAIGAGAGIALLGLPSAYDTDILGASDQLVGNFLLVVGGFFTALLVGYKLLTQADAELSKGLANQTLRRRWAMLIRYAVPVILLGVIASGLRPTWQALRTLFGV
ncbi:MAG: sodium-dependent transporter [Gemmatimonadales bacterium]|nr:MAG: sodium-dependent transporter [Gemmatimonadales bacterium]